MNILKKIRYKLNNINERNNFIIKELSSLEKNLKILDAGCGKQPYRQYCKHLDYYAQDFGQYVADQKQTFTGPGGVGGKDGYNYGKLDYVGDIWKIDESDNKFDVILCTEVLEHIPYPLETIDEFYRLLKPGGLLLLTAPFACLRHMDPYFFYSGFSDRWYELAFKNKFKIKTLQPVGDYYAWIATELAREFKSSNLGFKILLLPAFIYFYMRNKTENSTNTLCSGYHVKASKIS